MSGKLLQNVSATNAGRNGRWEGRQNVNDWIWAIGLMVLSSPLLWLKFFIYYKKLENVLPGETWEVQIIFVSRFTFNMLYHSTKLSTIFYKVTGWYTSKVLNYKGQTEEGSRVKSKEKYQLNIKYNSGLELHGPESVFLFVIKDVIWTIAKYE